MLAADPKRWGPDGWRKIVVCIVSDGRSKINQDTLKLIGLMGCYQDGLMRQYVGHRETSAHIFEVTSQVNFEGLPESGTDLVTPKNAKKPVIPMQLLFCLKEKNAKKINSHRWFFNAFSRSLKPNVCILLDVGTKPQPMSIYRLWRVFLNEQVGGACGEIAVEGSYLELANPIIAGQNFEYKMSNILDKPLESVAGYISVLPGAFSAYRWKALEGAPLDAYFMGEKLHDGEDVFAGNMYLAEDRILCFELVAKRNANWILRYEKNSQAITDAPDNFPEFIGQRRRWLNGSTFASLYAIGNARRILSSGQSIFRKLAMLLELAYNMCNFLFAFMSLANFYLAFHLLVEGFTQQMQNRNSTSVRFLPTEIGSPRTYLIVTGLLNILRPLYVLATLICFIASLGNKPSSIKNVFHIVIIIYGLCAMAMLVIIVVSTMAQMQIQKDAFQEMMRFDFKSFGEVVENKVMLTFASLVATYGVYFLSSFLYLEFYHPIFNILQYSFLLPTYVNVLQIYAYCNISDLSWGTKGATDAGGHGGAGGAGGANAGPKDELAGVNLLPANRFYEESQSYFTQLQSDMQKPEKSEKSKDGKEDNFKKFRLMWVMLWVFMNGALVGIILSPQTFGMTASFRQSYLNFLFFAVLIFSLIRFVFSLVYLLGHTVGVC
ncbi:chitin synthase-domain-containing protein [Catenaria anguillulae PL171]|uniref:Chitin synthase n=1 Tax=Catenaria anguillulae PL171 TaxID=765915 RepID=A0A1Y2HU91_9FUNG|nr:chitin synthase-domain-containing protein [Catenaria anguillulae PL171]